MSDGAQSDDLDLDCDYSDNETDLNYWAKEREEFSQVRRVLIPTFRGVGQLKCQGRPLKF